MEEIKSAVAALCEELGLPNPQPDAQSRYQLRVGDSVLRVAPWGDGEVVMEGVVLQMAANASENWAAQQDMLRQVLTWNLARLKGQARPEVLSFDEKESTLLLWRTWPSNNQLSRAVLSGAEEMLNELDFWRGKILSIAPNLAPQEKTT
jgi:hypothetical protein